jgi:hypothetical protein
MGITVSFWVNNHKEFRDNSVREIEVYKDLLIGMAPLDEYIKERTTKFKFDLDIVENLIGLSDFNAYSYNDLMIAVTDWRGFSQSQEMYSSLKEVGALRYIKSKPVKIMLEEFYNSATGNIIGNMEDDIIIQREILRYLNYNHPKLVLNRFENEASLSLVDFKDVLKKDLTLRSLILAKHRFISNKYEGILEYDKVQKEAKELIKTELNKRIE